jgi:hypothetical protein
MRYYFDYKDHVSITDGQGVECRTLEDARDYAEELAEQFAKKAPNGAVQTHVVVVDSTGREVFRTPISYGERDDQSHKRRAAEPRSSRRR